MDGQALRLFRYLYCEGDIVVVQKGVEVLRCDRMWISPIDDRVVVENAEIRYRTTRPSGKQELVVRGPRLVKQGPRWIGEDLTLTTCTAAEPHAALHVAEAEIIERIGEFEVVSRGQTIQAGGVDLLPVPDARVFTGSQSLKKHTQECPSISLWVRGSGDQANTWRTSRSGRTQRQGSFVCLFVRQ